jgi:hypothetical protein
VLQRRIDLIDNARFVYKMAKSVGSCVILSSRYKDRSRALNDPQVLSCIANFSHGQQETKIPDRLFISYTDDYNIVSVHETILKKMDLDASRLREKLENKRAIAEKKLLKNPNSSHFKEKFERADRKYRKKILGEKKTKYLSEANGLIHRYKQLGPKKKVIGNVKGLEKAPKELSKDTERIKIISEYLEIASHYFALDYKRNIHMPEGCYNCFSPDLISENGLVVCKECGAIRSQLVNSNNKETSSSTVVEVKSDYEDRENFRKALLRFQGRQTVNINPSLYEALDKYFSERGMPTGAEIKSDKRKNRNMDLQCLLSALHETDNSSYYEDANLIMFEYWGKPLPDISKLEDKIMSHYDKTQAVFTKMDRSRESSLGTQYRLFKHLQLVGYPCTILDFKIATIRDSLEVHESLWFKMCIGANDPEIYPIPSV